MKYFANPAMSIDKLARRKFVLIPFDNEWKDLIGTPECAGSWIVYGNSGNGKTTFSLQLLKYMAKFKKCAYLPLEEGTKLTFKQAIQRANLVSVSNKVKIWDNYTVQDLDAELPKPKSPDVIFIDSLQYLRMHAKSPNQLTSFEYLDLLKRYPKKLFVFISHAKNNEPKGALAESVYFGSDVCLYVDNFKVQPRKSRYGGKVVFELNNN